MEWKPTVKAAAQPATQVVRAVINRVVEPRLVALEGDVSKLKNYVPAILDAVSNQHAATRHARREERKLAQRLSEQAQRVDAVEQRMEFLRREVLFEVRYGTASQGDGAAAGQAGGGGPVTPRIVNAAKVESFGDDIRLNLGAGHIGVEGYLNVDSRELDGIDIVADVQALPFGPGEVQAIYSAHMLEHFPLEQLRRALLPYWYSLLAPGGRFIAVVPDAEAMLDGYAKGEISFADLREVTFGGQEYDGDFHFNMYSRQSLTALLSETGFVDAEVVVCGRRNGLCYEMQVEARRA